MLVVLTGAETIGKRLISSSLILGLNTFKTSDSTGGYVIEYSFDDNLELIIKLLDPSTDSGEFIYSKHSEEIGVDHKYYKAIDNAMCQYEQIFKDGSKQWYKFESNVDVLYDYNIIDSAELPIIDPEHMSSWRTSIEDDYKKSPLQNHVISGTFSVKFLDDLYSKFGDDLVVINIIRNPSVSWLLDYKAPMYYQNMPADYNTSQLIDQDKYLDGLLTGLLLLDRAYIKTLRFEDIIANNSVFHVGWGPKASRIVISNIYKGYKQFNDVLTEYESTHIQGEVYLEEHNEKLKKFNPLEWHTLEDLREGVPESMTTEDLISVMPSGDLFAKYGYKPLNYKEITTKDVN